ncbi:transposable element Tcb1 transposase [Trichonephila clavipes]|nr:transposable element Tcb1 transposase [Trichonephila clavipes]
MAQTTKPIINNSTVLLLHVVLINNRSKLFGEGTDRQIKTELKYHQVRGVEDVQRRKVGVMRFLRVQKSLTDLLRLHNVHLRNHSFISRTKCSLVARLLSKLLKYLHQKEIGSRVGRNKTTVMRICDRWMQEGTTDRRDRSHPPQCTTSREDRQIVCMAVRDRSDTSHEQHIESVTHHSVSARTIRRCLQ